MTEPPRLTLAEWNRLLVALYWWGMETCPPRLAA